MARPGKHVSPFVSYWYDTGHQYGRTTRLSRRIANVDGGWAVASFNMKWWPPTASDEAHGYFVDGYHDGYNEAARRRQV